MNNEFWREIENLIKPITPVVLEYRLYYNEEGNITSCSMQNHAEGIYIVVSKNEYELYFNYQIIKGKLIKIDNDAKYRVQLTKSTQGFPVVKGHAGLLIEDEDYKDIEYYARTN
jgi:hypothetical protein